MKRFLIRLFIFAIIMALCDVLVGFVGNYLVVHAKGGDTKRKNYIANETKEDILIFGSSRAIHHYDPDIFEDTLGLTTYNCGFDGNGIICAYGYLKMIEQRYHPKLIIYEVTPNFDLLVNDNNRYLGELRYFYDSEGIDTIFHNIDKIENVKMLSNMYRFNSALTQLIMDNLNPLHGDNKGYRPLNDNKEVHDPSVKTDSGNEEYDSLKLYYIEKFINDCKGKTALVFAISPLYKNVDMVFFSLVQSLCEKYNVPMIYHYTDSSFNNYKEYFNDTSHLNRYGATEYSKMVVGEIKQLMEQQ